MRLTPEIHGAAPIHSEPAAFLQAFGRRASAGLLAARPHPRSNYTVTQPGADHLHVHAADWRTAIAVGLNEVDLVIAPAGTVRYQVQYWRWATYVLGIGGVLGAVGALLLLIYDVGGYIARYPERTVPGLSVRQTLLIAWAMVVFWGFLWPWILIGIYKTPLRRLMTRLINEVDAVAGGWPQA